MVEFTWNRGTKVAFCLDLQEDYYSLREVVQGLTLFQKNCDLWLSLFEIRYTATTQICKFRLIQEE